MRCPTVTAWMLWNNLLGQVTQIKPQTASDWISKRNDMAGYDSRCLVSRLPFPALSFIGLKKWGVEGASHGFFFFPDKMGFSHSLNINDCLDNSFPMQVSFVLNFQSCHHDLSGFHNEQLFLFYLELVSVQKVSSTLMTLWRFYDHASCWPLPGISSEPLNGISCRKDFLEKNF